eukprot:jgi/Mesvir1/8883/Mv02771-RA.1
MPPKQKSSAEKKAEAAKRNKIVEDKTFGLKNKNKSKKVMTFVNEMKQNAVAAQKRAEGNEKEQRQKKKEEEKKRQEELDELFKVAIVQPKPPPGVDPKSIVCEYYRRGQCTKGFKCKYSHDLAVERKTDKINLYADARDENETMEDWDQEKLEKAVQEKDKEYKNQNRATDIICKHFLEAIEKKQYGWFWICPNGGKECMYRHALPPGYVLKSQLAALAAEAGINKVSTEENIESERAELTKSTPLTKELFMEFLRKKEEERAKKAAEKKVESNKLSGREMFEQDPSAFMMQDDEGGMDTYTREDGPQVIERTKEGAEGAGIEGDADVAGALEKELEGLEGELLEDDGDEGEAEEEDDDDIDDEALASLEADLTKAAIKD